MKSNYRKLGDFIEQTEERNKDLVISLSQGICNLKYFQNPRQVAENSSADKIVRSGWFAYNRATTRNGDKISIAYRDKEDCTVSASYLTFKIKDENLLNPYYLMLWFKRPEFDRYARFKSHGSAHEYFEWEEMCDVMLPVPSIEEQRKIVAEYQAVEQRIENNRQMIAKLDETAQTIYRHMFVDNIDPENLPQGWRIGKLKDIANIKGGKRLPPNEEVINLITSHPYIRVADILDSTFMPLSYSNVFITDDTFEKINRYIVNTKNVILSIVGTIGKTAIIDQSLNGANLTENCVKIVSKNDENNLSYYIYLFLNSTEGKNLIEQGTVGGVQAKLPIYNIEKLQILVPSNESLMEFKSVITPLFTLNYSAHLENVNLHNLLSLLLSNLSKIN